MTQRITQSIHFDTGIRNTDYSEKPAGQSVGQQSTELLPAGTTVSQAIHDIFPAGVTASGEIMQNLISQYASPALRTASGFHSALRNALQNIRTRKGKYSKDCARVLDELLADTDLLDSYRASLLES